MVFQLFNNDDGVSPEQAYQIGKEFAENYLEGKHKYIVVTHLDSDNLHNHIVFNEVETKSLKMFITKREITLTKLRKENDILSRKYNLTIPEKNQAGNKINYMRHGEIQARLRGRSLKSQLEESIDAVINQSTNYDEFLQNMEARGCEHKPGRHL